MFTVIPSCLFHNVNNRKHKLLHASAQFQYFTVQLILLVTISRVIYRIDESTQQQLQFF